MFFLACQSRVFCRPPCPPMFRKPSLNADFSMTGGKPGERKKIKYVYYHCGNLDPRCRRKHAREEGLE